MDKNNVDTAKELRTVISFCSGYGGIERGLDLAGVEHRVLAYVEIEAYAKDSG
jgi:site-specific DNA-cytosine methylase